MVSASRIALPSELASRSGLLCFLWTALLWGCGPDRLLGQATQGLATISFQDGVAPTAGYQGTTDDELQRDNPDYSGGGDSVLFVDGNVVGQDSVVIRWDLTSIPPGSVVQLATVGIDIENGATATFEAHALLKSWVELETTWNNAAVGQPWEVAGAKGPSDSAAAIVALVGPTPPVGVYTFSLDPALVQQWVDSPASNDGILIGSIGATPFAFHGRDWPTPTQRPQLSIDYLDAPAGGVDAGTGPLITSVGCDCAALSGAPVVCALVATIAAMRRRDARGERPRRAGARPRRQLWTPF